MVDDGVDLRAREYHRRRQVRNVAGRQEVCLCVQKDWTLRSPVVRQGSITDGRRITHERVICELLHQEVGDVCPRDVRA